MKYIIGILIIVALALAGLFISGRDGANDTNVQETEARSLETDASGEHRVVVTKDGHDPDTLTIARGDTVVFSASDDYETFHWPASNIHPTHLIYSEFDPKRPLESNEQWSFTFDLVGEWKFHDHLAPYHTGTIVVEE